MNPETEEKIYFYKKFLWGNSDTAYSSNSASGHMPKQRKNNDS